MNNAVVYLVSRLSRDLFNAFRHWYGGGFGVIAKKTIDLLERLDRQFALRITLKYFFRPLYGDPSIPGRIFGFLLRTARLVIAVLMYTAIIILAAFLYLVWALIPIFIIYVGLEPTI